MAIILDLKATTETEFSVPGETETVTLHVTGETTGDIDEDTVYMLHFEGTDESQTFTDEIDHTFTASGGAKIDDATCKFGSCSGYFDGTGDYISAPADDDHAFGTGDFTVDFWMRLNTPGGQCCIFSTDTGMSANLTISYVPGYAFYIYIGGAGKVFLDSSSMDGSWVHLAFVRSGSDLYLFKNGTQVDSTLSSSANLTGVSPILIGGGNSTFYDFKGWLDELRVSTVARWTSAFTAPSSAYEAAYTEGITVDGNTTTETLNIGSLQGLLKGDSGLVGVAALDGPLGFDGTTLTCTALSNPVSSLVMTDGGTIGQSAGPLVAFDDTNNYLEITGCNVGIGTTTPFARLTLPTGESNGGNLAWEVASNAASRRWWIGPDKQVYGDFSICTEASKSTANWDRMRLYINPDGWTGVGTTFQNNIGSTLLTSFNVIADHGTTGIHLWANSYYSSGRTRDANLFIWASEAYLSYSGCGIGNNVKSGYASSPYFERIDTGRGGSYIRLLDGSLTFSTVDSSDTHRLRATMGGGTWSTSSWLRGIELPQAEVLKWVKGTNYAHGIGQSGDSLYFGFSAADDASAGMTYGMYFSPTSSTKWTMFFNGKLDITGPGNSSSTYTIVAQNSSSSPLFYIRDDGVGFLAAAAWSYSDKKNKEKIEDLPSGGVDRIKLLKPINFDFKDGKGPKGNVGFLAEDVQSVIPEAVAVNELGEEGELMLCTSFIVPHIVKAVHEIAERLEKLEKK